MKNTLKFTLVNTCQPRWLSGLRRSRVHSLVIARRSLCPEKLRSNPGQGSKAKQINILGSRQHLAEKVALWCEFFFFFFFFFSAGGIAIFVCLQICI